jgi:16S rRNA (guanine(966)-N(2))-methyltransferase RsmD
MRVVAGKYKRRRFDVPHTFKARPTTDFAKENLFNVLGNLVDFEECAAVLDLFSGTGSIGLEFVSRGCGKVISVEKDYAHYSFISKVQRELGDAAWLPLKADVFKYIERCNIQFDIVFADPPYTLERLNELPDLILGADMLAPDGMLVLEHGAGYSFINHPHFMQEREYGSVHFSFFTAVENKKDDL